MDCPVNNIVYAAECSPLLQPETYRRAYDKVSAVRQKKADSFRFPKDKALSVGAELLLRHALQQAGVSADTLELTQNLFGKPELAQFPELHFNLSHAGRYVVCAISDSSIGCDIEQHTPIMAEMAQQFFSPEECSYIFSQQSVSLQIQAFYRIWTLRESYAKALGLGLSLSMSSYRILPVWPPQVFYKENLQNWQFQEFFVEEGYSCALCSQRSIPFHFEVCDILNIISEMQRRSLWITF